LFNAFSGNLTTALGLEHPASRIYLLSALVGIALYLLLIPPFGMIAAAGVTVFIDVLTATRFFILLHERIQLGQTARQLGLTVLAAGVMGGVVMLTNFLDLFLVILVGALTYGALVLWLGLIDWTRLFSIAQRFVRR
jgi:O-antigen/teichoic acid export membrane protein